MSSTPCGLDSPGIESWWDEIFCTRPDRSYDPPSIMYIGCCVSLPVVKRLGRGFDNPPQLVPRLKKEYSYKSPHICAS
jgi:hypothetical protein